MILPVAPSRLSLVVEPSGRSCAIELEPLSHSRTSYPYESQSPPAKVERERISDDGRRISIVSISPVAFELRKRRTRANCADFSKN